MGFFDSIIISRQRAAPAPGPAAVDYAAIVAAAANFHWDAINDTMYSDDRTTPATVEDTVVQSSECTKIGGDATYLHEFNGNNAAKLKTSVTCRGGRTLYLASANDLIGTVDDGGANADPQMITATKYWGTFVGLGGGGSTTMYAMGEMDSSQQVGMYYGNDGSSDDSLAIGLDRVTGGIDSDTIKKVVANLTKFVVTFYFDGTDLRWKWDDDSAGESLSYAGEVDPLGTSVCHILRGNVSAKWYASKIVGGSDEGEGYSAGSDWWEIIEGYHDALYATL